MIRVGFTGTREGMTRRQQDQVHRLLIDSGCSEFHHGDCVGADAQAHALAEDLGLRIVIHPPDDPEHRAWRLACIVRDPKPYLARNRDIVNGCDLLIAAPRAPEARHSGTWSTVRYARKRAIRIEVVYP